MKANKPKRIRLPQRSFRATPEQWKQIDRNVQESGLGNFSNYARRMLIEKQVVVVSKFEIEAIKELATELSRIGNNINQIARIANSTGKVFKAETVELVENQKEIASLLGQIITEHQTTRSNNYRTSQRC